MHSRSPARSIPVHHVHQPQCGPRRDTLGSGGTSSTTCTNYELQEEVTLGRVRDERRAGQLMLDHTTVVSAKLCFLGAHGTSRHPPRP